MILSLTFELDLENQHAKCLGDRSLIKAGTHYPYSRLVNTGVILDTRPASRK